MMPLLAPKDCMMSGVGVGGQEVEQHESESCPRERMSEHRPSSPVPGLLWARASSTQDLHFVVVLFKFVYLL